MALDASETLLADFKNRSRRYRRRIRRLLENNGQDAAPGDQVDQGPPAGAVPLEAAFNEAVHINAVDADQDEGDGPVENNSSTWSHERVDRGREMDRLEQILLRENHEFHLHC